MDLDFFKVRPGRVAVESWGLEVSNGYAWGRPHVNILVDIS